jgi:hypothetical protein
MAADGVHWKNLQLFLEVAKKGARVCVKTKKKNRKIRRERAATPRGQCWPAIGSRSNNIPPRPLQSLSSSLLLLLKINQQTTPTSNQTKFYMKTGEGGTTIAQNDIACLFSQRITVSCSWLDFSFWSNYLVI